MSIDAVRAPVYYVDNTPPTLDVAASLLADTTIPTPHLTTIIADRQSAGRGRLGFSLSHSSHMRADVPQRVGTD